MAQIVTIHFTSGRSCSWKTQRDAGCFMISESDRSRGQVWLGSAHAVMTANITRYTVRPVRWYDALIRHKSMRN